MPVSLTGLPATAAPLAPSPKEAERQQIIALVEQFEGMLLTEMLRDVRAGDDEDDHESFGLGGSTMNESIQSEFGLALSRAGGLGMGDMLVKAFARQQGVELPTGALGGLVPAQLTPPAAASAREAPGRSVASLAAHEDGDAAGGPTPDLVEGLVLPLAGVTSNFGWRSDPLTGQTRFHKGTDLRMAYGSEVRAAAPGVVLSADDRPGYGLTVVVDHGSGRETRYAHLSAIDVAPGDPVGSGQLIARSGNSGRTTGAHLHFEAREFGRPVDPRLAAESWTGRNADTSAGESDGSSLRY